MSAEEDLRLEHAQLMEEHREIVATFAERVERIRAIERAMEALGEPFDEDEKLTEGEIGLKVRDRAYNERSTINLLRDWVDTQRGGGVWSFEEALEGIKALGWKTTSDRPLEAIRPLVAKLAREGVIERSGRAEYFTPDNREMTPQP